MVFNEVDGLVALVEVWERDMEEQVGYDGHLGLQLPFLLTEKMRVNYLLPRVNLVITIYLWVTNQFTDRDFLW